MLAATNKMVSDILYSDLLHILLRPYARIEKLVSSLKALLRVDTYQHVGVDHMRNKPIKQVIVMRRDLRMRRGKEIAQGAHAAMAFLTKDLDDTSLRMVNALQAEWLRASFRKVCVQVHSEEELLAVEAKAKEAGVEVYLITDNGLTEFRGVPTPTCLALGPDYDEIIDLITGHLELY
jgi:PTH2 family peptidyl-tRNA hydrolase